MSNNWFIPDSTELPLTRIDATLGMRAILRASNDRIVPGIGGLRFVRQAVWSCAAIALANFASNRKPSNAQVANALEALACKLAYRSNTTLDGEHLQGITRLTQNYGDPVQWSFAHLAQSRNYVTQPFRQSASVALGHEAGLGLAKSGAGRLNFMELSERGQDLVDAFFNQRVGTVKLRRVLLDWVEAPNTVASGKVILDAGNALLSGLRPGQASGPERKLIAKCLELPLTSQRATEYDNDSLRRTRLYLWLADLSPEKAKAITMSELEALLRCEQTAQASAHWTACLENFYIERFLNAARAILQAVVALHVDGRNVTPLSEIGRIESIAEACELYCATAQAYQNFANVHSSIDVESLPLDLKETDHGQIIEDIARRVPLLMRVERGRLVAGLLMRTPPAIDVNEVLLSMSSVKDGAWLPRRLDQFRRLTGECLHG